MALVFTKFSNKSAEPGKYRSEEASGDWRRKNANMAIWLGKQYLGQKDNPEESVDMEDTAAYLAEAGIK